MKHLEAARDKVLMGKDNQIPHCNVNLRFGMDFGENSWWVVLSTVNSENELYIYFFLVKIKTFGCHVHPPTHPTHTYACTHTHVCSMHIIVQVLTSRSREEVAYPRWGSQPCHCIPWRRSCAGSPLYQGLTSTSQGHNHSQRPIAWTCKENIFFIFIFLTTQ